MIPYLDKNNLKDAITDSESFVKPFTRDFDENERLAIGLPGKVPKGKPRVTDNTLAGIVKEAPKRIIQQMPTGKVTVKNFPDSEDHINAVLTDDILRHANSGGTPRSKVKNAVKKSLTVGSSWAYCFYNRRGDWFGADFKLVNTRDVLFEKGKTSEFDCNFMFLVGWYTKNDLEVILKQELAKNKKKKKTKADPEKPGEVESADEEEHDDAVWDIGVLKELIENGESEKDDQNKSKEEKIITTEDNGYIKLYHCFQLGYEAEWYTYSKKLDKIVKTDKNHDPRGTIPLHGLYYDEDYTSPYGISLVSQSAGKQRLLDFDMQMYQYNRGYSLSPTILNYGSISKHKIKIVPDNIINMGAASAGNKIEPLTLDTTATRDFPTNYGLIKSQIQNESGMTGDSSISGDVGNPGFSKTDAGVNALQARLGVTDNDIRKNTESWIERVYATLLNIHFACGQGKKELELTLSTTKRMKLEKGSSLSIDYDQDYGKLDFDVDAGTTEAADNQKESEALKSITEDMIELANIGLPPSKDKLMIMYNQRVQNSGVDDPEKLMYSDQDIADAVAEVEQQKEMQKQALEKQKIDLKKAANNAATTTDTTPPTQNTDPMQSQDLTEDEAQTIEMLKQRGIPDEDIATAITMHRNNMDDSEIQKVLAGARQ